ncbi:RICIN domain-containing protein [Lentzea sp. NPDC102401]|uniref:RICIN domain-containing protein n=1 Tax=Lentzea sp. NPDC102401 TaxID=3364128 RepID=UPI00381DF7C6
MTRTTVKTFPLLLVAALLLAGAPLPFLDAGAALADAVAFSSTVVNQGNGNCATAPSGVVQLTQRSCDSTTNQKFTFSPVAGTTDTYTVGTSTAGSCADISGASGADNAAVIQYACHSDANQRFRLQAVTISGVANTFALVAVGSSKCVAPSGDGTATGTGLVQLPCGSMTSRVWRIPGFSSGPPTGDPPSKTVRVLWLRPSDVPFDQRYPDGIGKVVVEAQKYYRQELGRTFTLNPQIVEVVVGDHVKSWYENTPNGPDRYWWSVFNMQNELTRKKGLRSPDSRWLLVGEISAEGPGAGGGGGNGWVILCQHDADGAAGIGGPMNRWYGGMVHELGHALGLPDSTSTDGTPMSASFYDYPNTHFSQAQKTAILNGPYGGFLF